ncbi:MAG: polyhydroxybutyrate depolymerase [Pseudomonadota bacterium]
MKTYILSAALALIASSVSAQTCGDRETPCVIDSGTYYTVLPDGAPQGAVIMLHGGGGRAESQLGSGLAQEATARGFVFVSPQGFQEGARFERDWAVKSDGYTPPHDDLTFLGEVMDKVAADHGAPRDAMLLAGFSRGGSMVWNVACDVPGLARAYAPAAGALWDSQPETCAGPVDLFHTHGWDDRTVPLEGRSLFEDTVTQGDVWASLKILRETNGCRARQPSSSAVIGDRWWRYWDDCDAGRIDLMLHSGGHGTPEGWAGTTMDWFETRLTE